MEKEEKNSLSFLETIIVLALNDKGWFGNAEQRIKFGLAGAVLFELEQAKAIELGDKVKVTGITTTGDKVLDAAIEVLKKSKKDLTVKNSIQKIVYKSGLKWKVLLKNLVKRNILKKEEESFLWIITQNKYPIADKETKKQILADLYAKLIGEKELSSSDLMLLSVMRTCRMIDKNFLLQEYFLKVRLKIREITEFKEPLTEQTRKIKIIQEATIKAIRASNVNLHI